MLYGGGLAEVLMPTGTSTDGGLLSPAGTAKLLNQASPPLPGARAGPAQKPHNQQRELQTGCGGVWKRGRGARSLDYGDGFTVHTRQNSSMTVNMSS